jgi:predicted outer membrane repeat protein
MADRNRRFIGAAIALSFLFVVMSGLAQAMPPPNLIYVTTLDGFSESVPGPCSLTDAVAAANTGGTVNNCAGESGANTILFDVTGTINLTATLSVTTTSDLSIEGPTVGGIAISGRNTNEILDLGSDTNVTLTSLTFLEGGNVLFGGAIYATGTTLTIENSTFSDNGAGGDFGGAIFADSGTVTITNSTFAGNTTSEAGGAIYNADATLLLTNDTFDKNTVTSSGGTGGSLYSASPVTKYKSSLFAGGTPNNCAAGAGADHKDIGFNISTDNSCAFSMSSSKVEDPGLSSAGLAQNGGPTETIALVSGANAIGHDTDCTDQSGNTVVTDQRLYARPDSPSKCDSGAYEFDAVAPIELVKGSERLQLVHAGDMSDQINTSFSFIDNGPGFDSPACDTGNDAFNFLEVGIAAGTCAELPDNGLFADMTFATNVVNHQTYGTDYYAEPGPYGGILSARMVALPTPAGSCGEWTLNLELSELNLYAFGLEGTGPFALFIEDGDDNAGCFDIDNAIVGGKIDPPTRTVRRGVRR